MDSGGFVYDLCAHYTCHFDCLCWPNSAKTIDLHAFFRLRWQKIYWPRFSLWFFNSLSYLASIGVSTKPTNSDIFPRHSYIAGRAISHAWRGYFDWPDCLDYISSIITINCNWNEWAIKYIGVFLCQTLSMSFSVYNLTGCLQAESIFDLNGGNNNNNSNNKACTMEVLFNRKEAK